MQYSVIMSVGLVSLFSAKCTDPDEAYESQSPPALHVHVEPADLMTTVRGTPIRALVGALSWTSEEALTKVAGRFSMKSESGRTIPLIGRLEPSSEELINGRFISLSAEGELESEWHEVHVDLRDTIFTAHPSLVPLTSNMYFSRFHPDSNPVLRAIRYCGPLEEGTSYVLVEFSEPIDFAATEAAVAGDVPLELKADGESCRMAKSVWETGTETEPYQYSAHFEFICPAAATGELVVNASRDLIAASGRKASFRRGESEASEIRVLLADAFDIDGCQSWRMP